MLLFKDRKKTSIPNTIPTKDNIISGVIDSYEYSGNTNLEILVLPSKVTRIKSNAFSNCCNLREVIIKGAKAIGSYAFKDCRSLEKISLPYGLKEIDGSAFENCSSLKEVEIPITVKRISFAAFKDCRSLEKISLPYGLKKVGYRVFENCSSLKEVKIPKTVKWIGSYAFKDCTSLSRLVFKRVPDVVYATAYNTTPWFNLQKGLVVVGNTLLGYAGEMMDDYHIVVPTNVTSIAPYAFKGCNKLGAVICDTQSQLKCIGYSAFENCPNIKELVLPNNIKCIEDGAFRGCSGLEHLRLPDKLKNLGHGAFKDCKNLSEVDAPAFFLDRNIDYFYNTLYQKKESKIKEIASAKEDLEIFERNLEKSKGLAFIQIWEEIKSRAYDQIKAIYSIEVSEEETIWALYNANEGLFDELFSDDNPTHTYKWDNYWRVAPPKGREWSSVASSICFHGRFNEEIVFRVEDEASKELLDAVEYARELQLNKIKIVKHIGSCESASILLMDVESGVKYKVEEEYVGYNSVDDAETYYRRYLVAI